MSIETHFLESVARRMREYKRMGEGAMAQLQDHEFNWRPNEASNSVAQLVAHLSGNMRSRWTNFLHEDGEKSWRNRDQEFANQPKSREKILADWEAGWEVFLGAIEPLAPADLLRTITIRSEPLSVLDAITRQVAHYSTHVGQILYLAKIIRGNDWNSLSIPKGGSAAYNQASGHFVDNSPNKS
jgi:hypothetical protein